MHELDGSAVARLRVEGLPRHVRADDVDRQAPLGHLVDGGELTSELREPHLPDPHGEQQVDLFGVGGDRRGKRGRVDPELVARWQEDVVEAIAVGGLDDVTAMVPRALQLGVRDAEELVVVVAQGTEPLILLTAKNSKAARLEGLASAASDYINKPFEEEELRLKTRNILAEQEAIRRKYIKSVANIRTSDELHDQTPQSDFMQHLYAILQEHYQKTEFTVQDLARLSNVSDRQLLRRLKNETGIGVSEFIRNYRLHKAADLLKAGKSASFTAYEVGFTSPSYFSTSFKKLFNTTPKQFSQNINSTQ